MAATVTPPSMMYIEHIPYFLMKLGSSKGFFCNLVYNSVLIAKSGVFSVELLIEITSMITLRRLSECLFLWGDS